MENSNQSSNKDVFVGGRNIFTLGDNPKWNVRKSKGAWTEFAETSTFHGLRYISDADSFLFRRLFWLLLVLSCTSLMLYQIIDRVIYYCDSPVNVNVKINYNQSLVFPAVTICNQNAFRATQAKNHDWYRLIERMYSNVTYPMSLDDLELYNATQLSLVELFTRAAHEKRDLIVSCSWGNVQCTSDNFTTVLTDHGVCFTFNGDRNPENTLRVTSTGAEHGLKLTLNVEQYEYMPGPHDAAGVKLLTHSPRDFPRVHDLGIAIPTGNHAFVGMQVVMINNLPAPHGDCSEKTLIYYSTYSADTCEIDCITYILSKKCGCRHYYMPSDNGLPRVCTLREYYTCYLPTMEFVRHNVRQLCSCPTPCQFVLFDPMISYATTSGFAVERLLAETDSKEMTDKFYHAREVTHWMEKTKHGKFAQVIKAVDHKLSLLRKILLLHLRSTLDEQITKLNEVQATVRQIWDEKEYLYRYQEYVLQKNFMRGRDAMEERTLSYIAFAFHEFAFRTNTKLSELVDPKLNYNETRFVLYRLLTDIINDRIETSKRALANTTKLFEAYANGTPIFRYKFMEEPRKNNYAIVPKPLLAKSVTHNSYARRYSPRVARDVQKILASLSVYADLADVAYYNNTLNFDYMELAGQDFIDACEDFYHSKSQFYFETVDWPLRIIQKRIFDFELQWKDYEEILNESRNNVLQLNDSLLQIEKDMLDILTDGTILGLKYLNNFTVSKAEVADVLTSDEIHDGINKMKSFFQEVRTRGQDIFDGWTAMTSVTKQIWRTILVDEDMQEYYHYQNMKQFLRNYSQVASEIETNMTELRDNGDIRFLVVASEKLLFLKSLYELMDVLSEYIEQGKMDKAFLRENFLQLDVFYRELSYEEITQQVGYDVFSLLCDIGGSIGLFIGASVMSLFEILDLLFKHSILVKLMGRRRATSQKT